MKRNVFAGFFILLLLGLNLTVVAQDFTENQLNYTVLSTGDKTVAVMPGDYKGLTSLNIPETVVYDGVSYTVTEIGDNAFLGCEALASVNFPNSLQLIGKGSFEGCKSLSELSLPDKFTTIGDEAFRGCTRLATLSFPETLTGIGDEAFRGCTSLTSCILPNSLLWIDWGTFRDCTGLTSIQLPEDLITIGNYAFSGCTALTSISFPNTITWIGRAAFRNCTSFTSIDLPEGLERIDSFAFSFCTGLKSLVFPESFVSVSAWAFIGCTGLTSLTFPENLQTVGNEAFAECTGLQSIVSLNPVPPVVGVDDYLCTWSFSELTARLVPLYVPEESIEAYRAHPFWGRFKTIGNKDATNIDASVVDGVLSGAVYTVDGKLVAESADRLHQLPRGIYVVGGKKVVVK